jgi:hypothetical protein
VATLFANRDSLVRLATAILMDMDAERQTEKRRFSMSLTELANTRDHLFQEWRCSILSGSGRSRSVSSLRGNNLCSVRGHFVDGGDVVFVGMHACFGPWSCRLLVAIVSLVWGVAATANAQGSQPEKAKIYLRGLWHSQESLFRGEARIKCKLSVTCVPHARLRESGVSWKLG